MGLFDRMSFAYVTLTAPVQTFQPTFEKVTGYGPGGYRNPHMNPDYFATRETAEWIRARFGAREVFERVAPGNEGPFFTASKKERWIRFEDGTEINAGQLASIFIRNPEAAFPGLAERIAKDNIAVARTAQKLEEGGGGTSGAIPA